LIVVLFALGVMSLFWMVLGAAVIFAQKILPGGERATRALAVTLVTLGIWIAVAPGSVPDQTQTDDSPAMKMGH
jgi:predicted metal-binding membrane protein